MTTTAAEKPEAFSAHVDDKGNIVLPGEFRSGAHLGTWVLTSSLAAGTGPDAPGPQTGIHNVYAAAEAVKKYRQNGKWPDGAALVMEVRALDWHDLSTGHVIGTGDALQWFVMIKDGKGRFPGNVHWAQGWGWAVFKPGDPKKNVSTGCKQDCLGCHETAQAHDFIFLQGYPILIPQEP